MEAIAIRILSDLFFLFVLHSLQLPIARLAITRRDQRRLVAWLERVAFSSRLNYPLLQALTTMTLRLRPFCLSPPSSFDLSNIVTLTAHSELGGPDDQRASP